MRKGEWSLLRLLSVGERMKGHSDMIKPVLFLCQFRVYRFGSSLSKKNRSFFLKKASVLNLSVKNEVKSQSNILVDWHVRNATQKVGFSYLEIEKFWKKKHSTAFQTLCVTTRPISANKQFKNDKNINWTSLLCLPKRLTTSYGINSFSYLAATSWNSLPDHYRIISDFTSFRRLISTGNNDLLKRAGTANLSTSW